jgi:prephenate dehydrogenase
MREPGRRLAIVGVGLIGGSVGLAARRAGWDVVGFDPASTPAALARGAIDRTASDAAAAVVDADLVVLAVPVGSAVGVLRAVAGCGAVVTDVCSTKRSIVRAAGEAGMRFVGSHPMAGGERGGVGQARAELLDGALCLVTPTPATDPAALDVVEAFWRSLGMRTRRLDPDEHDRLVADVSHVPHAAAAAVARQPDPAAVPLAAGGWRDVTRVAGGDPDLWRDILLDNRDHVRAGLVRLRADLDLLLDCLDAGDGDAVRQWLAEANRSRHGGRPAGDGAVETASPNPTSNE